MKLTLPIVIVLMTLCMVNVFAVYSPPFTGVEKPMDRPGGGHIYCKECYEDAIFKKYEKGKLIWERCDYCNYAKEYGGLE